MKIQIVIPYGINRSGIEIATVRLAIRLEETGLLVKILEKGETHTLYDFPVMGLPDFSSIERYLIDNSEQYDFLYWAGLFEKPNELINQVTLSEKIFSIYHKKVSFFLERTGKLEPFDQPLLYRRVSRMVSKVSVANSQQKQYLESMYFKPNMVEVLPTGVDTENEFYPPDVLTKKILRQKALIRDEGIVGIYTGRFVPRKGLDLLLNAWRFVPKANTLLLLIGSGFDDPLSNEKQVRDMAQECGNVMIMNYTDTLKRSEYYSLSDFAIFAGRQEGEPTALVESMSCGLPVIASNISGHNELVIHNQTGLLFEPENREELIMQINKMISSTEDRVNFGKNARSALVKSRDIKIIAEKFVSLLGQS